MCQADVDVRKLPDLRETKKIGQDRLTPAIFISTIGMQSIATTAGVRIDQRHGQVVAAEKPREDARCDGFPLGIAIRAPRCEAGSDRRRGFHGLLIEGAGMLPLFAEAGGADRPEMTCRCRLLCHQPAQGPQSGIDVARRLGRHACHHQSLRQARVVVSQSFLEPHPIRRLDRRQIGHQPVGKTMPDFLGVEIIRSYNAISA